MHSSSIYHEPSADLHLVSYVTASKCPDTCRLRNQTFLTSRAPLRGTSRDRKKKPALAQLYEFSKGRHDAVKQSPPPYSCKPKCMKWTVTGLAFILDIVRMNSAILVGINTGNKVNGNDFGFELARSLTIPFIYSKSLTGLQYATLAKMYLVTQDNYFLLAGSAKAVADNNGLGKFEKAKGSKKRCFHCMEGVRGLGFAKKAGSVPRVTTVCQECGTPSCTAKHLLNICTTCYVPPDENSEAGNKRKREIAWRGDEDEGGSESEEARKRKRGLEEEEEEGSQKENITP